ncbi:heterokaryon incompatibility protein-domain-containing protein [Diplogelasinospora grovesii]|uniref:Heterokaryon incompatibility protein-domain-containing protein n=1 Tax=Diplogelasinospora grovesii TaxID=303347 RepID=A0AAN6N3R3_9PEZI|nr:heterokaryon incompatibility protein-domain-containing protein [Diplogelasinospora grovesii]
MALAISFWYSACTAEADELSVDLIHTSLDKAPCFTALSYPWGDPEPRKAIRCSGFQAEIGPSLHMALQYLRKAHLDIFVWADALCINQEDIPERTQQVRIMSEIYAAASTTAIWLGEESDELVRVASEFDPLDSEYGFGLIDRSRAENMLQAAFGKHRGAAFGHLWALLSRPWFTRKWVIQELVKSRRPLMVVGRLPPLPWAVLAGWMNFVNLCPAVKNHFLAVCPRPQVLEAGTKILGMNMRRATILTQMEAMGKQVLLFLIARTLGFHCGDPRDHIFALLGIASDRDCFDHIIDYNSPAEEIWRRTSLKLLWSLVMFAPLNRRVHSWVPNLENVRADGDGSILASQFTVQQLQAHLDDGGKMLTIRGRIIDRLQLLGSDSRSLANSHTIKTMMDGSGHFSRESMQRMLRHRCRWLEECSANGEEAFRDALLYDHLSFKEFPKDLELARTRFSTQIRLEKARAYAVDNYSFLVASMESMSLTSSLLLENLIADKVQRRFGRTEGGRIGWLPPVAEEGDFICIFDGMELPYHRYAANAECSV